MKKSELSKWYTIFVTVFLLCACSNRDITEDIPSNGNSSHLSVITRGVDDGGEVSYPVAVYIFNADGCCAVETLETEEDNLSITLPEGSYELYAIAGASTEDYDLPTQAAATTASMVALKEGKTHSDLICAHATATLTDGADNSVTLSLERKIMQVKEVTIKSVPAGTAEVSVYIAPLWENIKLDGSYDGEGGKQELTLTKQADGRTWKNENAVNCLPSVGKPSITISITKDGTKKEYTYVCTEELEANSKLTFEGTYTEEIQVTMTATVEGAQWGENRTVSFEFNGSNIATVPPAASTVSAGDIYKGCYVLAVNGNKATLLSPNEKMGPFNKTDSEETKQEKLATELAKNGVDGIDGWRVMTVAEAQLIHGNFSGINAILTENSISNIKNSVSYMVSDNGELKKAELSASLFQLEDSLDGYTYLRPVAEVTLDE